MKVLLISPEIQPFAGSEFISDFSNQFPVIAQELKNDIRLIMPKYPFISERKFTLREVIRLKEIMVEWNGETKVASIKSAFVPNTKVQIYFLHQNDFFSMIDERIYKAKGARKVLDATDDRYSFFVKASLESLQYLHWQPDVIYCCGWTTAVAPIIYKALYSKNEFYENIKFVFLPFTANEPTSFSVDSLYKSKIEPDNPEIKNIVLDKKGFFSPTAEAIRYSDSVFAVDYMKSGLTKSLRADKTTSGAIKALKKNFKTFNISSKDDDVIAKASIDMLDTLDNIIS